MYYPCVHLILWLLLCVIDIFYHTIKTIHSGKEYYIIAVTQTHTHSHTCRDINNGVYRAGFATKQEAYNVGVKDVFAGLDRVEEILSRQRYLIGPQITEADVRLYTTLVRFDCVYVGHFKVMLLLILHVR